jgi:hypothetical protein
MCYKDVARNNTIKRIFLLLLVITFAMLIIGGSFLFFYSCGGGEGEENGTWLLSGKLYVGGYESSNDTGYIYVIKPEAKDIIIEKIEIQDVPGARPD